MWGRGNMSTAARVRGYSFFIWVLLAVGLVNFLRPHTPLVYDLLIGIPVGAAAGAVVGHAIGYLLTPKKWRKELRDDPQN
jgi:hypothetical protein